MKKFTSTILILFVFLASMGQTVVTITDEDLAGDAAWTNDHVYLLNGFVYLEEGTLTIEAGTVVKGMAVPTTGDNASALIITQGARIEAIGTPTAPIIFTAEFDDIEDPADLDETDRGLWGGLILLGYGRLGFETETSYVEGIPEGEERAVYGGSNDDDDSGILRYVSVRHGGAELSAGNEINGVTFGGVGRNTVVEHVEVIANDDDGFEWFGGAVSAKWLVSAFNKDDAFDFDMGWRGNGQFWFAVLATDEADNAGEHDGAKPDDALPFSKPVIYNATYIGSGVEATTKNSTCLHFRDATGGTYANSIFTEFANEALEVEDLPSTSGVDSRQRMEEGDLVLKNNIWWAFGSGDELNAGDQGILRATSGGDDPDALFLINHLSGNENTITDAKLRNVSRVMGVAQLDPRLKADSPAWTNLADFPEPNDFYSPTSYRGAFGNFNWALSWTAMDFYGYFGNYPSGAEEVIVTDSDLENDTHWTADKTYILDGFVYLEEGTLIIDAGTVVKGMAVPTTGDNASALIITQGARIEAIGTPTAPIIFTAEFDDIEDPADLDETDRGLWGGLILLGYGRLGFETETSYVEGIPEGEERAVYGGSNDDDDSGILRYVSVRHGGAELSAGNEINGVTFGGVGRNTVVEHVEVIANDDDGFEWFGGAVSAKWLVSAFNKDDAFDFDMGWRGNGQFWFAVLATDEADNAGEHDGAKPDDALPFSKPVIYNATYIGSGVEATTKNSTCLHFRDATGGTYANSIFTEFANEALEVEDLPSTSGVDSRQRMEEGDLVLKNNIWWAFGSGDELNAGDQGILRATSGGDDLDAAFLIQHLTENHNELIDPKFSSVSRAMGSRTLIPQPKPGSMAYYNAAAVPSDPFFSAVDYRGAFKYENWASQWTAVDQYGFFGAFEWIGMNDFGSQTNAVLSQNYPNPFQNTTAIDLTLPQSAVVNLAVYDLTGKMVQPVLLNTLLQPGTHTLTVAGLKPGVYTCTLSVEGRTVSRKLIVTP
ncbi:MAG: T9SS type A sorting domain-containing protein [Bacteroidales bacterium]|nr:T9SS type A sorting domain-containing protein [Bacteroidales bacterium]